jgi:hypothetical protein
VACGFAHVLTLVCLTRHLDQTSVVRANGVEVPLAGWRWLPYETWRMGLGSPVRPSRRSTAPPPGNATPPCATANVTVASRMQFEANAVMQRFTAMSLQPLQPLIVDITFQSAVESVAAMPWLLPLSSDFANTSTTLLAIPDLDLPVQVTCHTISKACSAWAIMSCSPPPCNATFSSHAAGLSLRVLPQLHATVDAVLVWGESVSHISKTLWAFNFSESWDEAADAWGQRWADAFTPPEIKSRPHYSGSLPVMATNSLELDRMYYMAVATLLSCERTNLPMVAPRVYVTGAGNAFAADVMHVWSIGGTTQFAWDASFYAGIAALLDPDVQAADLAAWLSVDVFKFFGIELDNRQPTGYFYAFSAGSLYRSLSAFFRYDGGSQQLWDVAEQALAQLAVSWRNFTLPPPFNPLFPDFCSDPNCYLECVPTYTGCTAALQASAAFMARDLSQLRAAQGRGGEAADLRFLAEAIGKQSVALMYVEDSGWWRVIDVQTGASTEVRHVIDVVYTAEGFCGGEGRTNWSVDLSLDQRSRIAAFAIDQLYDRASGWVRALSLGDAAAPIDRPDHGSSGAYDAWPALMFSSITHLDGDFNRSLDFLRSLARVTWEGPYGQAHRVSPPNDGGATAYKTSTGFTRYFGNNGAAFAEVVLKVLFGYNPEWTFSPALPSPVLPHLQRGDVRGSLQGIRKRGGGYMSAWLTDTGVEFREQESA